MTNQHYTTIFSTFQDEVQANENSLQRWSDGKYKPTEKAERLLLKPSRRMLEAQAARQATLDEFFN